MAKFELEDETAWLKFRETGFGASEIPGLLDMDVHPQNTPYQIIGRKCGLLPPVNETRAMRRGRHHESFIAAEYERETGMPLIDEGPYTVYQSDAYPFLFCTPDRLRAGTELVNVQIKDVGYHMTPEWKEGVPFPVQGQVQFEMFCIEKVNTTDVVAWLEGKGTELFIFDGIQRDDKWLKWAVTRVYEAWQRVLNKELPSPYTSADVKAYELIHPGISNLTINLPDELYSICKRHAELKGLASDVDKELEDLVLVIKKAMGDAEYARCGEYWFSYKEVQKRAYSVEASKYRRFLPIKARK